MIDVSSKYFDYSKKLFTAEISDLPVGFTLSTKLRIVSEKTGTEVEFFMTKIDRNNEGEVQGWNFEVVAGEVKSFPKLAGLKVLIIND